MKRRESNYNDSYYTIIYDTVNSFTFYYFSLFTSSCCSILQLLMNRYELNSLIGPVIISQKLKVVFYIMRSVHPANNMSKSQ